MATRRLPKVTLAHLPTALEPLPRASEVLEGCELWVKRDDQTGLAFGGNKTRKLEYLVAEALGDGADTLVTTGAPQSNHCRQTAAAAARTGLACHLVLRGSPPATLSGNILLDGLLGAEITWAIDPEDNATLEKAMDKIRRAGHQPYLIPYGGSSPTGISAYVHAMEELKDQDLGFDEIVLASSSGGTQAGLMVGARQVGYTGRILAISVDRRAPELRTLVAGLANQTSEFLGLGFTFNPDEVLVEDGYLGGGYAVVGELERQAVSFFAQTEGLLLDPVYTGRAAGGMLDLIKTGRIRRGSRVLFWHTGGTPALFAFAEALR
jgi:D-cysteine desulfhydrase family pyridoxal phosphate-dependent enzyme